MHKIYLVLFFLGVCIDGSAQKPKNVIFILSDDHRYDAMGFMGKVPGLTTPNMDKMATEGTHIKNAFVTTALCSPSRASILTGQFSHTHTIVDNFAPLPEGLRFFPEYLQEKGYKTAFLGKWHMGNTNDSPQKGFDYWLSFKGQGEYFNPTFNINGKQVQHKDSSYITDLLTDYGLKWMSNLKKDEPFFMYLSHKAVHDNFSPAPRHKNKYQDLKIPYPTSMYLTRTDSSKIWGEIPVVPSDYIVNMNDMPQWVKNQRYSWHGVDFPYHGYKDFNVFYRNYMEALQAVDESIGRVLNWLEKNNQLENTLVIYMGDNGFSLGERGLIDKRHAYEESMRVPMLVYNPSMKNAGLEQMVQNIDIAPTVLEYAGITKPTQMQGQSFLKLLMKKPVSEWRNRIFYEYFWEYDFPQTPTIFAVRTDRYKYILNHGIWDANELYDLHNDPDEVNNLIRKKEHQVLAKELRTSLMDWLESTKGLQIPLKRIDHHRTDHRYQGKY